MVSVVMAIFCLVIVCSLLSTRSKGSIERRIHLVELEQWHTRYDAALLDTRDPTQAIEIADAGNRKALEERNIRIEELQAQLQAQKEALARAKKQQMLMYPDGNYSEYLYREEMRRRSKYGY